VLARLCDLLVKTGDEVVRTVGSNLLCRLLAQQKDESCFVDQLAPLLSSAGGALQEEIVREFFRTLLPAWPEASAVVEQLVEVVAGLREQRVVAATISELLHYMKQNRDLALSALVCVVDAVDNSRAGQELLDSVTWLEHPALLEKLVEIGISWPAAALGAKAWRKLLELGSESLPELTVKLAEFAAKKNSLEVAHEMVAALPDADSIAFLWRCRFEFQTAVFEFFLLPSAEIRALGRDLALRS
jgi:hypothetical protein